MGIIISPFYRCEHWGQVGVGHEGIYPASMLQICDSNQGICLYYLHSNTKVLKKQPVKKYIFAEDCIEFDPIYTYM